MNLLTIAIKNIRQRMLASSLTSLSVALGVMLMVTVLVIYGIVERTFSQNSVGYDLVIGRKGSEMDLVMSTVYRIGKPIENLPYRYYKEIKKKRAVKEAIPFAIGDFTEEGGFPIVGTISRYFELKYAPDKNFSVRDTPETSQMSNSFDAIIGSQVAKTNNWKEGSQFKLVHGNVETGHVHDEKFTVVGVLAATGTANDKTVFVNLEGFYLISGHEKPPQEAIKQLRQFYGEQPLSPEKMAAEVQRITGGHDDHDHGGHHHAHKVPDEMKEVTAILIQMKNPSATTMFAAQLKKGYQAQAANPIMVMMQLKNTFIRPFKYLMFALTAMIIVVSGISIFVSIYNSMADRKREIAIMRALGAQRRTVFSIILAESIFLCLCGGLLGLLLGHGLTFVAAPTIEYFSSRSIGGAGQTGLVINPWAFEPLELVLIPAMILLASLVGFIPGLTAYRTDVAETLSE